MKVYKWIKFLESNLEKEVQSNSKESTKKQTKDKAEIN